MTYGRALPPARSVSRMMCVMPALKPMKAVRPAGLEGSSLGNLWTARRVDDFPLALLS